MADINKIISLIDTYLEKKRLYRVEANEASLYLDKMGVLSHSTKGQPLRKILRQGQIPNAEQPGGKGTAWYIRHSGSGTSKPVSDNLITSTKPHLKAAKDTNEVSTGLAPIEDVESEILILGTLPGKVSLKTQQYYSSPSNHFWKIISAVFNESSLSSSEERNIFLLRNHIALWDVLKSANRERSLDSAIKNPVANDLRGFVEKHPNLKVIGLNGKEAYAYYEKYIGLDNISKNIRIVTLPSSSSSNTHLTLNEKIRLWKELVE